jgi:antagonist of KipI
MDLLSHRWANRLVGNPEDAATLEVTVTGPEIAFDADTTVAVAGAAFALALDAAPVPMHARFRAGRGTRLRFGARVNGARAYLAVGGGIDTASILGSRATHLPSRVGGVEGRPLTTGDVVSVSSRASGVDMAHGTVPLPMPAGGATLRILPGADEARFPADTRSALIASRYTIGAQSNRMGYRLDGRRLEAPKDELISGVTPMGALQVPPSGQPILLMADRATTGGYPLIANVISADLPLAGQLAPGDWIEFALCTHAEAVRALVVQERALLAS